MIQNVFGLAYGILLSYLVWIVFHYLTPLIMSFGWLGFIGILREFDISTSLLNMSMSQPAHVLQHKEARKNR